MDVDPSELEPKTIRFGGDELGVVTEFPDGTSRLVLKPVYQKYEALAQLVEKRGKTVIDLKMSASEVKAKVIGLVEREDENTEDIPEPSGGRPYVIVGDTYPIRETLKELGLQWDGDEKVWHTYDSDKWERAVDQLGATKTDDRRAKVLGTGDLPVVFEGDNTGVQFRISTDGACRKNPGPGGWAAVIEKGNEKKEIQGRERNTTNNRMELRAIIEALRRLPNGSNVLLRSDSRYAINVVTGDYDADANLDLVEWARELGASHDIEWTHVEGHSGDPENERADDLAEEQARFMHNLITEELGEPYVIVGDTYSVRETLKEHGFEWNPGEKVWETQDESDWEEAVADLGAERIGKQKARLH